MRLQRDNPRDYRFLNILMHIAIEGCCHGQLSKIYSSLERIEQEQKIKIKLLLICGDFQSIRNEHDLSQMSVPDKFKEVGDFHKYYTGEIIAPITTIFIGGNHEASNYLWELFHGGWVCPNIYYLGSAGVVNFAGLRIAGLSGIFKSHNYSQGFFERHPLRGSDIKSIYHVRHFSIYQLAYIKEHVDIFLSHDWPLGIAKYGNLSELFRYKSFLKKEIEDNTLGSPPCEVLLKKLKPTFWFSAHLHVKYAAVYNHQSLPPKPVKNPDEINLSSSDEEEEDKAIAEQTSKSDQTPIVTRFLALDKCLPKRQFLEIMEIEEKNCNYEINLDPEWLSIVKATLEYMPFSRDGNLSNLPTEPEMNEAIKTARQWIASKGDSILNLPDFCKTADALTDESGTGNQAIVYSNPQTESFCCNLAISNKINSTGRRVQNTEKKRSSSPSESTDELSLAKKRLLMKLGL